MAGKQASDKIMSAKKSSPTATSSAKSRKKKPSWSDIKSAIASFERTELIGLISDLYAYSTPNKNFLHARFSLGSNALKPYKKIIEDALYPAIFRPEL